jgi:hypothetical protein
MNRVCRVLLTSTGPRVAEAIFCTRDVGGVDRCANGRRQTFRRQTARCRAVRIRNAMAGFSLDVSMKMGDIRQVVETDCLYARDIHPSRI